MVALTVYICRKYSLDPNRDVYRHYDVCGKQCPKYYVQNPAEWNILKERIVKTMEGIVIKEITTVDEALSVLIKKDIINTPEHWVNAVKCVKFLDALIINFANYVNKV